MNALKSVARTHFSLTVLCMGDVEGCDTGKEQIDDGSHDDVQIGSFL